MILYVSKQSLDVMMLCFSFPSWNFLVTKLELGNEGCIR